MKKRPFSDIENIMAEKLNATEPAFDEASWLKMEALLDKEDSKPRPLIFWWLPILLGILIIGGYFLWPEKKEQGNAGVENLNSKISKPADKKNRSGEVKNEQAAAPTNGTNKVADDKNVVVNKPVKSQKKLANNKLPGNNAVYTTNGLNAALLKNAALQTGQKSLAVTEDISNLPAEDNFLPDNDSQRLKAPDEKAESKEDIPTVAGDISNGNSKADTAQSAHENKPVDSIVVVKPVTEKMIAKPKGPLSKIFFLAIGGSESNGTKLFSGGSNSVKAGIGLGYQLSDRLSIQTGFYTSAKKYTAGPGDYKAKPGSYWSQVNLTSIQADCRVFEIPVILTYESFAGKKWNWFASAGLSSYIMKNEAYHYWYYRSGTPYEADAVYSGNKHLLSVLRFSAGPSFKVNNKLSFIAAPGLMVPLKGVGEGSMKLYSTEFVVGLKYKPWHNK